MCVRPQSWKYALELILLREEAFPSFCLVLGITGLGVVVNVTWGFKGSPYHLNLGKRVHALAIQRKVTGDSLCSLASEEMSSESKSYFYRPNKLSHLLRGSGGSGSW